MLLCSRPIGHITHLARPSVWTSRTGLLLKNKKHIHVLQGTVKWSGNFQMKRSKVKVTALTRHQKLLTDALPLLGLIYCQCLRCSATVRTDAYHVGTRGGDMCCCCDWVQDNIHGSASSHVHRPWLLIHRFRGETDSTTQRAIHWLHWDAQEKKAWSSLSWVSLSFTVVLSK